MLYLLEHEFNWQIQAWAILMRLLQIKIFEVLLLCQSLQGKKKKICRYTLSLSQSAKFLYKVEMIMPVLLVKRKLSLKETGHSPESAK